eukprot:gene17186-20477_t
MPLDNPVFDIVYKSQHYIAVNKPFEVKGEVRFVNRIDYATSGIVLTATNKKATGRAGDLFQSRETVKQYLAIVWGHVDHPCDKDLVIDAPIADDKQDVNSFKMCIGTVHNPGRHSKTICRVLAHSTYNGRPVTKMLLFPHTGRRHQLRVHLHSIGHTIILEYST